MRAIVQDRYGPPDVLYLDDVQKPAPEDDEVLVAVAAASVNAADWHLMRADPFFVRLMTGGLLKPRHRILGADVAGRVEAVGPKVERFKPGDEVFGDLADSGFGSFAEYVCVSEAALAPGPDGLTLEEAAAVPLAGLAALHGLRDSGRIQSGETVLVNGASGGVGTFAVQIAKSSGAQVTGVCSTGSMDLVRSLRADHVIDYMQEDVTRNDTRYDLILDTAAYRSVLDYRRILHPKGRYVLVGGSTRRMLQAGFSGPWVRMTEGKRMGMLISRPNQRDLLSLKDLAESGAIKPIIDRRYALSEVPEAIRRLENEHVRGKIVITVGAADSPVI